MQIQRDSGFVRALGPLRLAATLVSMMIGASIFATPSALSACVGSCGPLAGPACSLGFGAVGICCAGGGGRTPASGGTYGDIEGPLGPLSGSGAGTPLRIGNLP